MSGRPIRFEGRAQRLFASAPENPGAEASSRRAALDLGHLGAPTVNELELNAALAGM